MEVVEYDFIIVFVEISTADIAGAFRMIGAPGVARIQKSAHGNTEGLFHCSFAFGNFAVKQPDAAVQAQPPGTEWLIILRLQRPRRQENYSQRDEKSCPSLFHLVDL